MFKVTHSIIAAAAIAGVITVLTGNSQRLDAGPLAEPAQSALKACTERPWPYLHCVGTPFGDPRIRLIPTEHFAQ
jgi:hypothetical protein